MGDPLLLAMSYAKPRPNVTMGVGLLAAVPFGTAGLSSDLWEVVPTTFGDVTFGKFGFDYTATIQLHSDRHPSGGPKEKVGNAYSIETALRYQVNKWIAPFINNNFQNDSSSQYQDTFDGNGYVPGAHVPSSYEDVIGAGLNVHLTHTMDFSLWYDRGIAGKNTIQTDAFYFLFRKVW